MNFTQKLPIDASGYGKPFHATEKEAHPMLPANLDQRVRLIVPFLGGATDEMPTLPRQSGNNLFVRRHPAYPTAPDSEGGDGLGQPREKIEVAVPLPVSLDLQDGIKTPGNAPGVPHEVN
jgi:hypothetical protein